jgi:hypothetical protein
MMREDLFGMANPAWPGLTPYAMFLMVLVSSLGILAMTFWTVLLVPAEVRARRQWRIAPAAPATSTVWRFAATDFVPSKRPLRMRQDMPAAPRNGSTRLTLVDAEARIGLPAAASSSESTVESKPKPVSAYATDIEKAIAGFRAAHAMLAERENGASTNGEAR